MGLKNILQQKESFEESGGMIKLWNREQNATGNTYNF